MQILLLLWIALWICHVRAEDDNYVPVLDDYDDDDNNDLANGYFTKMNVHNKNSHRNMTFDPTERENHIERIKNMIANQEKRDSSKPTKIVAGAIGVSVIGGLFYCFQRMCKKKPRTTNAEEEETLPALPPESNLPQYSPYPPIPSPYPPQQVPYPEQPNVFLRQPAPFPPPSSPYLQEPNPCPQQPNLFPLQPSPYPPPQTVFVYPTEPTTYPPPESGAMPITKT